MTVLLTDASNSQTTVTADATGAFSVSDVATPYSAAILQTVVDSQKAATLYLGLTRANPALVSATAPGPLATTDATLNVTLSGGTYPQPTANYTTNLYFASPQAQQSFSFTGVVTATNTLDVFWPYTAAGTTTTGTVYGLQIQSDPTTGVPVDYPGYGAAGASLTSSVTTNSSLELNPVTSAVLTGSVTLPSGYNFGSVSGWVTAVTGALVPLFVDSSQPQSFSYTVPSLVGMPLALQAFAVSDNEDISVAFASGLAANASGVSLDCPAAPTLLSPSNNETGVSTETTFSWSAIPESVYRFTNGNVNVWTASTTATIPELDSPDFQLPPSSQISWYVSSASPYASIDAFAAPQATVTQPPTLTCYGQSAAQVFTTSSGP